MYIAYITSSKMPTVFDAQAQRCLSIIKLFEHCDIDVISNCLQQDYEPIDVGTNLVKYYSYRKNNGETKLQKIGIHVSMRAELKRHLMHKQYDLIIFNDFTIGMMHVIRKYSKGAKLLYDAVEWYSPSESALGRLSYAYISNDYVNRRFVDDSVGVISISRYFDNYFRSKNINSFYMPVVLDKDCYSVSEKHSEKINIIYAGYMGKKDHIKDFIRVFSDLDSELKKRIELTIVGPDKSQFSDIRIFDSIKFLPFMPHKQLLELYRSMDFSILFRDEMQRYAKAGFPTKLAESMMCGVPLICNLFSNIGDYLVDGKNAFIVQDKKDFKTFLENLSSLNDEKLAQMKQCSRDTAEEVFEYSKYKKEFLSFLDEILFRK